MFGIRSMLKKNGPAKEMLVMLTCFALVFTAVIPVTAAGIQAQTEMKHSPPGYFVPEHRIQLDAGVNDPAGVNVVRCYFRAAGEADFVFVPMTKTGGDSWGSLYAAILPAPSTATEQIEYLFLTVNAENNIVKSQSFTINRKDKGGVPAWQNISGQDKIQVSMELDKVPSQLNGFTDNIVMNKVESGLRFGVVAGGLYYLTKDKASHTSGAAASATSSGTITAAAAAGYSTAVLVGAGVLGAAAIGGGAAALSGGGGGGGSHGEELTEQTIVGFWNMTGAHDVGRTVAGNITFNGNGTFAMNVTYANPSGSDNPTGAWTLVGTNLTLTFDSGNAVYSGQASGDSNAFSMRSDGAGWTLNFRR